MRPRTPSSVGTARSDADGRARAGRGRRRGRRAGTAHAGQTGQVDRISAFVDWMFRDRATGKIVIAQLPNPALIVWIVATVAALPTTGTLHTLLGYAATVALVVWAGDELLRGVNPFRRLLGVAVLVWEVYSLTRGG